MLSFQYWDFFLLCVSLRIRRCVLLPLEHVHSCQPVNHKCDLYDNGALCDICFEFFPFTRMCLDFLAISVLKAPSTEIRTFHESNYVWSVSLYKNPVLYDNMENYGLVRIQVKSQIHFLIHLFLDFKFKAVFSWIT